MLFFQDVGFGLPTTADGNPFQVVQFNTPGSNLDQYLPGFADPEIGFSGPPGFFGLPDSCATVVPGAFDPDTGLPVPRDPTPADFALCNKAIGLEHQFSAVDSNADVSPKLNRYTVWADASYELTDHIEAYTELLYNRRKTDFVGSRQLFFTMFPGSSPLFLVGIPTALGLPFFVCDPNGVNNCSRFEAGDPLNSFTGVTLFDPVVEIPTGNRTDVKYTRGVGGLRGDFGSNFLAGNWHYDAYVQYSRSNGSYTNDIVFQDAVDSQELRTHLCAGTVTRIRGVPCMDIDWTDPRVLAGNFTPEEKAFLFGTDTGKTVYNQLTGEASVSGDVVHLPAGPLGVALGVQWRKDSIDDTPGPVTAAGNVWGQSVSDPTRGHSITKEAFGEIQVPLIHNAPFIQDLNFSGAARLTDVTARQKAFTITDPDGTIRQVLPLSDSSKGNWTYKLGLNWQTNEWLRFRATMGTSYRAPALFEQFLGNTTSFPSQFAIDPCIGWGRALDLNQISHRLAANCASLGIPETYGGSGPSAVSNSSGGIGNLKPETSKAKTFSVVVTPLEGFWSGNRWSLAVDYFDIKVKGEITQLGAARIISTCLNSPDFPNDPTCALFDRNPPTGPNANNITQIRDQFINISSEVNRGVDLTAQMTQDFGSWGKLAALAQMTWSIKDNTTLFKGSTTTAEGTAGEPKWVGNFKFTWAKGPWTAFWGLDVIGGTSDEQALRDFLGGPLCNHSNLRDAEVCPISRLKPQFYHNVSLTRDIGDRFEITAGISNLFDRKPPLVSNADALISSIGIAPIFGTQYDLIGRRAFVSVQAKF
jgi:iron complex outermembrane receptor protein